MATARQAPSEAEVWSWTETLSNWGKWGPDDELGTLNHVTPEKRRAAAALVREGLVVSCARPLTYDPDPFTGRKPSHVTHWIAGDDPVPWQANSDEFELGPHGVSVTHVDALSHVAWNGRMYNGRPADQVTQDGALAHSIEAIAEGVSTRGVLLDLPRLYDRPWLEPAEAIYPEDLERAERTQGVRVETGDILFMRTGHYKRVLQQGLPQPYGSPGLQAACLPWLHARGVAMLGGDQTQDMNPSGYSPSRPGRCPFGPIHIVGIFALGLWLIDNCNHEALAETCARLNRWTFQTVIGPLPLKYGTASPVNPLAIF
jgi:kynurenine formamidase